MSNVKTIKESNEAEMILEFLKGEINSSRFNDDLNKVIEELEIDKNIINNGDTNNIEENSLRFKVMKLYRGYPDSKLFKNFPKINKWKYMELNSNDIDNIYYINYDYWNELSNNTSKPVEASKVIKSGKTIYGISNKPFFDGFESLKNNKFPPIILITSNDEKYLIIEGHSRMTIYGFDPNKLEGTFAYVGYCTDEDMQKYDPRMLSNK